MRRSWTPYLVLALSLLLTVVVTFYASDTAETQDRLRFQNLVQRNQGVLQNRMETYVALLRGATGLFIASEDVSREEFRSFISGLELDRRYPGIQGIGFALRVGATWKDAVTAEARREGDARFTIWPESSFDDLYPIFYMEPLDARNRADIGFDMYTEAIRRAAIERARDTGWPTATGRVKLAQRTEERRQSGFVIYVPVYRRGSPLATVEDRRESLAGFVYAPFRADDLLRGIRGSGNPNLALEVYAGAPSLQNLLHRSHPPGVVGPEPRLTSTERFEVAGSPWTIVYSSLPVFEAGSARDQVWILLLLGLLSSVTLFGVNRAQIAARAQAEAASQTKDHFMATLSHELRTPLTPVLAVLSRLEKRPDPLPSDVREGMATIRRNVELEARLIDDLLDLTRISQGKLELRRGPTDVRQVLAHALEASERAGAPAPALITEIENAELWTWADAPRLTQVFWNLISNARKLRRPRERSVSAPGARRERSWSRCRTPASASTPRCCPGSSTPFNRGSGTSRGDSAAWGSGWRSARRSWPCTAATSARPAKGAARAPPSRSGCPRASRPCRRASPGRPPRSRGRLVPRLSANPGRCTSSWWRTILTRPRPWPTCSAPPDAG
ncbi:MAG TPA: CHASE domain-containing protein [Thermoanaerobaculia bacterium]|nr:CHASE domain-containing protein [Thermoanaerobaculia bacterium]